MRITYTQQLSPETYQLAYRADVPAPLAASSRILAILNPETRVKSVALVDMTPLPGMAAEELVVARQAGHAALRDILQTHVDNPDVPLVELIPRARRPHLHVGEALFQPDRAPRISTIGFIATGDKYYIGSAQPLRPVKSWNHPGYQNIVLSTPPSSPYDALTLRVEAY